MSWSSPIFDRTLSDVEYAFQNQSSALNLKGAWNISDANRVIDNCKYLETLLNDLGYTVHSLIYQV